MQSHQDFKPIVLKKKKRVESNQSKTQLPSNFKIENDTTGEIKLKTISPQVCKLIQQKRIDLGMKQQDLARKINIRQIDMQNMENGSVMPSNHVLQQLRKVLNCKIEIK